MRLFGVYGTSGFGREVMPIAQAMLKKDPEGADEEMVFVDDAPSAESVNAHRILTFDQFSDRKRPDGSRRRISPIAGNV